jgi:hypothetical protein
MIKTVPLGDGREAELHFCLGDRPYFSTLALRLGRVLLGKTCRNEGGVWAPSDIGHWHGFPGEREAALAWYRERYPDLADADPEATLREGIAHAVAELAPLIERAREMEAAIAQYDPGLYVAVDDDGLVRAIERSAPDVVERAEYDGWEGWYSPTAASEDTLWITPANNVRVKL